MLIIVYITALTMYDLEYVYLSPMQTIKIQSVEKTKSNTVLASLHIALNLCAPRPGALHMLVQIMQHD